MLPDLILGMSYQALGALGRRPSFGIGLLGQGGKREPLPYPEEDCVYTTASRRRRVSVFIKYGLLASWLTLLVPSALSSEKDQLKAKLEELERRLEALEAQKVTEKVAAPPPSEAQTIHSEELQELRRQLNILAAEVELIRSGEPLVEVTDEEARARGLGPAAASVYRRQEGVSIAGYGEMLYNNFGAENELGDPVRKSTQLDFLRAIIYAGYRFNDRFVFNSEIEFEHASTSLEGSASVEFAYLDFIANDYLSLRGGLLLVPMGLVNELHEPTVFMGALRPETERRIIPSTWRENGVGAVGSVGIFDYRVYLINGLEGSRFSSNGLRGGRQKGSETTATDMAVVARLDVNPTPGVFFGGSFYNGASDQGAFFEGSELDVGTTIGELHGQAQLRGFDLRGLYAWAHLDDVIRLNRSLGLTGSDGIGESLEGGYLQIGYNLLSQFRADIGVMPYYRYEILDTQKVVPTGFFRNPNRDRTFQTLGLEFKPIPNIVIKSDFVWNRNKAQTGVNRVNVALGYNF